MLEWKYGMINELIPTSLFFFKKIIPTSLFLKHLRPVLEYGSIPETAYNVVKQQNYCGEVNVALTFHPESGRY
ncbi:hypothetical protein MTR_1g008930 [Medicago truncatula]|uniref:Uncharacterized protein n=1 Tax=Medicago truncatula TaxID=3880 RepID=G7I539_MEDTR|nr:hypothetical protein MTR_1g008930 [Medicago truncatula]